MFRCNPVELCGTPPMSVWLFNLISGTSSEFTKTSVFSLVELHRRWTGLLSIEKLWTTVEIYGFSLPEMIQWWRKSSASFGQHPNQCPCGNKSSQPLWLKPEANKLISHLGLAHMIGPKIPPQHFSIISPWSWMNQNFICFPISLIGFTFLWVVMLPNKAAYNSLVALVHQARRVFSMPRMGVCQVIGGTPNHPVVMDDHLEPPPVPQGTRIKVVCFCTTSSRPGDEFLDAHPRNKDIYNI